MNSLSGSTSVSLLSWRSLPQLNTVHVPCHLQLLLCERRTRAERTAKGWEEASFLPLHTAGESANTVFSIYSGKKLKNTETRPEDPRKQKVVNKGMYRWVCRELGMDEWRVYYSFKRFEELFRSWRWPDGKKMCVVHWHLHTEAIYARNVT